MKFNITFTISGDGQTKAHTGQIKFGEVPGQYGNKTYMVIKSDWCNLPAGEQYDLRYDTDYDPQYPMEYITMFYSRRFSGKDGAWKLTGISIEQATE